MDLKERFEHYEAQPDPKVWKSINKKLRLRNALRYAAMTGAAAVIVIITVLAYRPQPQTESQEPSIQQKPIAMEENLLAAEQHTQANIPTATALPQATSQEAVQTHYPAATDRPAVEAVPAPAPQQQNEKAVLNPRSNIAPATHAQQTKAEVQNSGANTVGTTANPQQAAIKANEASRSSNKATAPSAAPTKVSKVSPTTESDSLQIWIPNAFSPDDPLNPEVRIFKVKPKAGANISNFKMYIFNRAGSKVFHSTSSTEGWDGTYQNTKCPQGAYVYIIEYTDQQGSIQHTRGAVTLIR